LKFIVGVGNPGKEYEKTRHNVGFRVIDLLKKTHKAKDLQLIKPSTYVNQTGEALAKIIGRHPVLSRNILVVCDDVHLPFGKMRLRAKGSAGGHNGLKSVIQALDTEEFPRLRLGVAAGILPEDLAGFVLEPFSKSEEKTLKGIIEKAADVCNTWAEKGLETAQDLLSKKAPLDKE